MFNIIKILLGLLALSLQDNINMSKIYIGKIG